MFYLPSKAVQQHHFVVCKGIPRKVDADSIPMIPPGKREPDRSRGVFLGVGTSYSILAVCTNFPLPGARGWRTRRGRTVTGALLREDSRNS